MKILHGILGFLLSLVVMAAGCSLVAQQVFGLGCSCTSAALDGYSMWMLGGVLIVLVLLYWISYLSNNKTEHYLSFEGDDGTLSIGVTAINEFVARLKSEFRGVVSLKADVTASRNHAVDVVIDLSVKSGVRVQQLSQQLQQRVREAMRESLGIAEIGSIKINVSSIVAAEERERDRDADRASPVLGPRWRDDSEA